MAKDSDDPKKFGVDISGEWDEIVEKGKKIKERLEEEGKEKEAEEWERWRPKEDEKLEEEMTEKSAEQSVLGEETPEKDKKEAKKKWDKTKKGIGENNTLFIRIYQNYKEAMKNLSLAFKAKCVEKFKRLEKFVYKNITTKYAPKYYETEEFHSSIEKKNGVEERVKRKIGDNEEEKEEYKLQVNFEDDDANEKVDEELNNRKNEENN